MVYPALNHMSNFFLKTSVKLLLTIVLTEALIMASFAWLDVEMGSFWTSLADVLLLGAISSIVILFWVIKPLKKAKQQNDLFNALVENVNVGVIMTDARKDDNPIIFANPAFSHITGYAPEDVIGKNPRLLQSKNADLEVTEQTHQAIREQRPVHILQKNMRKDGTPFWNDLHLNPIMDNQGRVAFWIGLLNDVTATRELERQNSRWASVLKQSDDAVCIFERDGSIEYANEAFCKSAGLEQDNLVDHSMMQFWDQQSEPFEGFSRSLVQEKSWSGRHKRYRLDGTSYDALSSMTPVRDEDGALYFASVHKDITDMVAMEEQLRQSQKMEAVGMLVGGIAHDFNNVLTGILGNLYLVKRRLIDSPKLHKRIENIEEQGYSAAAMVRQLLSFSRKGVPDIKEIDLSSFAKELVKFAHVSVPESMQLTLDVETRQRLVVRCDPIQMQQSLLNLIVNATHAIHARNKTGGRISIRISVVDPLAAHSASRDDNGISSDWVCISIEDNGIGMDEETKSRMFEPFFTTKPRGVGTGLGLAMIQGYVEMLHGSIDVQSKPGDGTCFNICLPLSHASEECSTKNREALREGNGECILIADDDETVRAALRDILEAAHYRVIEAVDGEEAKVMFSEHSDDLDMAILDVVMPKAGGVQVADYIHGYKKGFPVVFMTGYDKDSALSAEFRNSQDLLRKPWDIEQLNSVFNKYLHKDQPVTSLLLRG